MTDFRALLEALVKDGVDFIVVGGAAATAHGSARLTLNLDVAYRRSHPNRARLVRSLRPLHPYLRGAPPGLPFQWDEETLRAGLNFTLVTDAGDLGGAAEKIAGSLQRSAQVSPGARQPPPCLRRRHAPRGSKRGDLDIPA